MKSRDTGINDHTISTCKFQFPSLSAIIKFFNFLNISCNTDRYWHKSDFASHSFRKDSNSFYDTFVIEKVSSNSVTVSLLWSKVLRWFRGDMLFGLQKITLLNDHLTELIQRLSSRIPPLQLEHYLHRFL